MQSEENLSGKMLHTGYPPHLLSPQHTGEGPYPWPACVLMADMGMVLMIVVVPGLVVLGDTLLVLGMVELSPAPLACVVVMMVVACHLQTSPASGWSRLAGSLGL